MRKVSNMEGREFSEKMKKFLKEKKLSSRKFALMAGISTSTFSEYLSGKYFPSKKRLKKFAELMEVEEAWLAGYSENDKYKETENEFLKKIFDKIKDLDDMQLKKLFKIIDVVIETFQEDKKWEKQ